MPLYWEHSVSGVQAKNFDIEHNDEDYVILKPKIKNVVDEEQVKDLVVNTILIFDMQMSNKSMNNNCRSEGFGMHDFEDDLSWVSFESIVVFAQSLAIFRIFIKFIGTFSRKFGRCILTINQ
jgi:hypothetical protein